MGEYLHPSRAMKKTEIYLAMWITERFQVWLRSTLKSFQTQNSFIQIHKAEGATTTITTTTTTTTETTLFTPFKYFVY